MRNNIKVLYVEDDNAVVQFVKVLFKKNNIEDVDFASNGKEALVKYKNNQYDLVITDIIMPFMDGFELIEQIRKIHKKQIVLMTTGLDNKEDLIKAIELRVHYFIDKPIIPKKFANILDEAIILVNQRREAELSTLLLNQYKHAVDTSTIVSKTNLTGRITYVNDTFCKISQYTSDELLGQSHNIVRHPDVPSYLYKNMWDTIQSKKQWKGIIKNRAKDGSEYIVDSVIIPLLNEKDQIIEYLAIRHDITKLEFYKENLQKQLDMAVKEIVDTQKEVVYTMGAIGETRSKETGQHVKRVAEFSYLLATLAGLSKDESELLKLASSMHDIGKVGIRDDILNKPGKLTFEEFEIIKTHTIWGYDMLKGSSRDILKTSAIVAYEHHERWDGKGYPRGLKEYETHIYGRITAICDVFDALAADRCYKKAWEIDRILELFKEERGKQFDPNLIDLFFANLDKFIEIRDRLKD